MRWITGAVLAFLWIPIGVVLAESVNADPTLNSWGGFTLHWFATAANDGRVISDLGTSLLIGACTATVSAAIAVTTALGAQRVSPRLRELVNATTYVRIILPEVVIAVGLFLLLHRVNIPLGDGAIVAGHVVFCSAYATIVVQARLAALTGVYEEAATDLGATPWRVFRRVTAPLLRPALIVAGLLSFTFSFDDVVTSLFLGGSSAETLPVLLLGLVRIHVTPEVNAIGVGVMVLTLLLLGLLVSASSLRGVAGSARARARKEVLT
jgi:ABC-type spermidine/putrescine transport system permease subunit II